MARNEKERGTALGRLGHVSGSAKAVGAMTLYGSSTTAVSTSPWTGRTIPKRDTPCFKRSSRKCRPVNGTNTVPMPDSKDFDDSQG